MSATSEVNRDIKRTGESPVVRCPGCEAQFPVMEGPTHAYMLAAPGCWALYTEVLAREYSSYRLASVHRLTVDTYAAQHPGVNVPAARRSVGVHLARLYLLLEGGWSIDRANQAMLAINGFKDRWAWLEPPSMAGTVSVLDVHCAATVDQHEERVRAWAASVWAAWDPHHATVREWCAGM